MSAEQPPEEKVTGRPFHELVVNRLRRAVAEITAAHPEVRSIMCVIDYRGGLNEATIPKAVWAGAEGPVNSLDGVFGMAANTLRSLDVIMSQAAKLDHTMRKEAERLGQLIIERNKELGKPTNSPGRDEATRDTR